MSDPNVARPAHEQAAFAPPAPLAAAANVSSGIYAEAQEDRLAFWSAAARRLSWSADFTEVLDWSDPPFAQWFVGGKINVAYNCVDRQVERGLGDKVAFHFVGEPGDRRDITYAQLKDQGQRCRRAGRKRSEWLPRRDRAVAVNAANRLGRR
jgi:acetyl-CoA synthetase